MRACILVGTVPDTAADVARALAAVDGVVWIESKNLKALNGALHHLQQLAGVRELDTLVEEGRSEGASEDEPASDGAEDP